MCTVDWHAVFLQAIPSSLLPGSVDHRGVATAAKRGFPKVAGVGPFIGTQNPLTPPPPPPPPPERCKSNVLYRSLGSPAQTVL